MSEKKITLSFAQEVANHICDKLKLPRVDVLLSESEKKRIRATYCAVENRIKFQNNGLSLKTLLHEIAHHLCSIKKERDDGFIESFSLFPRNHGFWLHGKNFCECFLEVLNTDLIITPPKELKKLKNEFDSLLPKIKIYKEKYDNQVKEKKFVDDSIINQLRSYDLKIARLRINVEVKKMQKKKITEEVKVSDLLPNPFRKIDKYPISKDKIEHLKASIEDSGFWDNIVGRKKDSKYEIAYGHHRLQALNEAGIKKVNIILRDLTDHQMIKIMANENMEMWKTDSNVIRETVAVAKEQLERELMDEKASFYIYKNSKRQKGGKHGEIVADDIAWYLGGAWKKPYQKLLINEALGELRDVAEGVIDEEDIQLLDSPRKVKAVREAVRNAWSIKKEDEKTGELKQIFQPPKTEKEKEKRKVIIKTVIDDAKGHDQSLRKDGDGMSADRISGEMVKLKVQSDVGKRKKMPPDISVFAAELSNKDMWSLNEKLKQILDVLEKHPDQMEKFNNILTLHFWNQVEKLKDLAIRLISVKTKSKCKRIEPAKDEVTKAKLDKIKLAVKPSQCKRICIIPQNKKDN